jgi:hypothetical protein
MKLTMLFVSSNKNSLYARAISNSLIAEKVVWGGLENTNRSGFYF